MKIDSHQHFWRYYEKDFAWIGNSMQEIRKDFLPEDLKKELQRAGFDRSIAVQARQSIEETSWLLELASLNNIIAGVVGWVDLCSRQLENQLDSFTSETKLVGVRHVIHDEPDIDFMLNPEFLKGIGILAHYKLTYDILIFPKHLPNTIKFVKMFPNQSFVIDHIAKPDIKNKILSPWKEDIQELAKRPNVFCKFSGMVTEAEWKTWKYEDFKPYLDAVLESFGPERLMIGSDWPVCKLAGTYPEVMGIVEAYIQTLSETEQAAILGENASRVYGV